jgi:hypothetical protein
MVGPSGKFLEIGMPGSECCFCEGTDTGCEPHCTGAIPLYSEVCFPYTCCPCPETGDYTATASIVLGGGCSLSASIDMTAADGIAICSGENPDSSPGNVQCYSDVGPYYPRQIAAEKFGKYTGTLCSAAGGCSGTDINLSLCCCGVPASQGQVKAGSSGECHMCNYQLKMTFLPLPGASGGSVEDYCGCPTGVYDEKMLPTTSAPPYAGDFTFTNFDFVDGSCDPFYLEFEATGLYWNCDCCQGGSEEDVDNDVTITVTIT